MQHIIKEELQQIIPANLISSQEEISDAELEFVAGGIFYSGTNVAGEIRVNGSRVAGFGPLTGSGRFCVPGFTIPRTFIPVPASSIENFKR